MKLASGNSNLGSNPFAFSQQKNVTQNKNQGNKRVFNNPFGDTPSETSYNNGNDPYNQHGINNDSDDFNFQADPIQDDFNPQQFIKNDKQNLNNINNGNFTNNVNLTFNEEQDYKQQKNQYEPGTLGFNINNVQPDGGPGAQRHNQGAFTSVTLDSSNSQNQRQIRGPLPNQRNARLPPVNNNIQQQNQHNNFTQQQRNGMPNGYNQQVINKMYNRLSEDVVSLDEIQTEESYNMNYQKQQNYPQQNQRMPNQNKFAQPFQQSIDPSLQGNVKLQRSESQGNIDDEDEVPLLEDLGIDLERIKQKLLSIITQRGIKENADYDDMAGPLIVCVLFGFLLLCKGKVQFGYIYGFGLTGCLGIYSIINLLSKRNQYVELYKTTSILGYSLMPFTLLALLSIFVDLNNIVGGVISIIMIIWSTVTATRYFEYGLDMEDKKYLIAYPISLFYFVFMLLSVF